MAQLSKKDVAVLVSECHDLKQKINAVVEKSAAALGEMLTIVTILNPEAAESVIGQFEEQIAGIKEQLDSIAAKNEEVIEAYAETLELVD